MLEKSYPERAKQLSALAQKDVYLRWKIYEHLAQEGGDGAGQEAGTKKPTTMGETV